MGKEEREKKERRAKVAAEEAAARLPVTEKIRSQKLIEWNGWSFTQAFKEKEDGTPDLIRWIARKYRLLPTLSKDREKAGEEPIFFCTEALLSDQHEDLAFYGFTAKKESEMRISGLMKPDPIPVAVIATLLGFKGTYKAGKLLMPGDPEFQQIKAKLELNKD